MSNGQKPEPDETVEEDLQLSTKRGLTSDAKKHASSRHGYEPAPQASPTAGAFGREQPERRESEPRAEEEEQREEGEL